MSTSSSYNSSLLSQKLRQWSDKQGVKYDQTVAQLCRYQGLVTPDRDPSSNISAEVSGDKCGMEPLTSMRVLVKSHAEAKIAPIIPVSVSKKDHAVGQGINRMNASQLDANKSMRPKCIRDTHKGKSNHRTYNMFSMF